MRRASRVDANQPDIVDGLRAVGATVQHIHTIGKGCPDILAGFRGANYLLEIKPESGRVTADEALWHLTWNGQVTIARTLEQALAVIGAI